MAASRPLPLPLPNLSDSTTPAAAAACQIARLQDPLEFLTEQWNADTPTAATAEPTMFVSGGAVGLAAAIGGHSPSISNHGERETKYTYQDHMNDPDGDYTATSDMVSMAANGGTGGVDQSFPVRLHYMLNELEKDGMSDIVSWQPHGRCFLVHNKDRFIKEVLGSWFRMSKYPSFQRQLNIYGFQRLTAGADKGGYYHELFLRCKPGLSYRIRRHKLKGTGTRKAAVAALEPNFYGMAFLPLTTKSVTQLTPTAAATTTNYAPPAVVPLKANYNCATTQDATWGSGGSSSALTLKSLVPTLLSQPPSAGHGRPTNDQTANTIVPFRPLCQPLLMAGSSPGTVPTMAPRVPGVPTASAQANMAMPTSIADYQELANCIGRMQ